METNSSCYGPNLTKAPQVEGISGAEIKAFSRLEDKELPFLSVLC